MDRALQEVSLPQLMQGGFRYRPVMLTTTYERPDDWRPHHISGLHDCLRQWAHRRGFIIPGVWVAEIQPERYEKTGESVVHYHLIIWVPKHLMVPKPDKQGWWPHGGTTIGEARSPAGYLMKYASKGDLGDFPRGLRLSGGFGLTQSGRDVRYWLCLPSWLHAKGLTFQRITRLPGGILVSHETGETWRSPWVYMGLDRSPTFYGRTKPNGGILFKLREPESPPAEPVCL